MSCATKTRSSTGLMPNPVFAGPAQSRLLNAIIDAFKEALEMRRAVHRSHFLGDE